jgi:hypothetical protein
VPETPSWAKLLATLAVAAGGALPFLLRRPTTYEVAISAAFAFLFAAFYLLATGTLGARLSLWRMAVGSLCLGLSVGARADLALAIAVPLALWAWLAHTSRLGNDWSKVKTALALVGPVLLCGVLVLVYNKLRFESFTEFGQRYALTGRIQPPSYKLEYLAPGLYFLLVAPARLTFAFPFFHLPPPPNYPGKLPTSGYTVELAGGLLSNVPLTLGGLALPLLRHRGTLAKEAAYLTGALLALGLLTAALISFANTGFVTMRYEVDFATIVVVGALMCWFATLQAARVSRRAYSLASAALVVFALWGILYGVAISFDYYDQFRQLHPQTYDSLARFFRPVPTLLFILGFICAAWLLVGGRDDGEADAGLTDDVS